LSSIADSSPTNTLRGPNSPQQRISTYASAIAATATTAASSASSALSRSRGSVDESIRTKHEEATVAETAVISVKVARQAKLNSRTSHTGMPGVRRVIPWYIVDPTGGHVRAQRSDAATRYTVQRSGFQKQMWARLCVRWPTLYPGWDAVMGAALVYTALVTPFEVGFLAEKTPPASVVLTDMDLIIDLLFVMDVFLQFVTMRPAPLDKAIDARVEWEMDPCILARTYVCSLWFVIDVASLAPSAIDYLPSFDSANVRFLRVARAVRLVKLLRLARSSRVLSRTVEVLPLSSTTNTCLVLAGQLLLITHWVACVLMIAAGFRSPLHTWLATFGYCTPDDSEHGWICIDPAALYLHVLKWSMGLVCHNGFPMQPAMGPYPPYYAPQDGVTSEDPFTVGEQILIMVLKLAGLAVYSLTISKLIRAITVLGNPAVVAYQMDIDAVNRFCSFNRVPTSLARQLRRYVLHTREVHAQRSRANIYSKLSPLLVVKITRLLNRALWDSGLIQRAIRQCTVTEAERFVCAIVVRSTMAVFSPGDRPPAARLYIITEGVAVHKVFQVLGIGDSWGDEGVLLGDAPSKARETKAMTYLRVLWIARGDFAQFAEEFPEAFAALRLRAIWRKARRILKTHRGMAVRMAARPNASPTVHEAAAAASAPSTTADEVLRAVEQMRLEVHRRMDEQAEHIDQLRKALSRG